MTRPASEESNRIAEAVRNWSGGPLSVAEISALVGLPLNASFRTRLTTLVKSGKLRRAGQGLYEAQTNLLPSGETNGPSAG